ncbi:MAG: subclass B3 metallo-beta-lactamase [Pirellulaceae bacterium]|jgi:metallo-beta-lactamase class B|nr:subclass B3 metallo-beta-lactamase [Pirellulaceae bacterium]
MVTSTFAAVMIGLAALGQGRVETPYPAHRVVGNVYYVGSRDIAVFLVATDKGHVLINSGYEETVPLIRVGVESLGFKMKDVKVILASHAHSDHVAGHALLREMTGAEVYVMKGDEKVIEQGGKGQYLYTTSRWKPCPVARVLKDGDKVAVGDVTLVGRRTPGHTPGCTTWAWPVVVGKKTHHVVIIGSPNVNPGYQLVDNKDYPKIAEDFATTFKVLKGLKCDVFLGAHGAYYGLLEKHDQLGKTENPFIDPAGYREYVASKEAAFRDVLKRQQR